VKQADFQETWKRAQKDVRPALQEFYKSMETYHDRSNDGTILVEENSDEQIERHVRSALFLMLVLWAPASSLGQSPFDGTWRTDMTQYKPSPSRTSFR